MSTSHMLSNDVILYIFIELDIAQACPKRDNFTDMVDKPLSGKFYFG